jgi:hypothetical protein
MSCGHEDGMRFIGVENSSNLDSKLKTIPFLGNIVEVNVSSFWIQTCPHHLYNSFQYLGSISTKAKIINKRNQVEISEYSKPSNDLSTWEAGIKITSQTKE